MYRFWLVRTIQRVTNEELHTLSRHMRLFLVISRIRDTQSLIFYVLFYMHFFFIFYSGLSCRCQYVLYEWVCMLLLNRRLSIMQSKINILKLCMLLLSCEYISLNMQKNGHCMVFSNQVTIPVLVMNACTITRYVRIRHGRSHFSSRYPRTFIINSTRRMICHDVDCLF